MLVQKAVGRLRAVVATYAAGTQGNRPYPLVRRFRGKPLLIPFTEWPRLTIRLDWVPAQFFEFIVFERRQSSTSLGLHCQDLGYCQLVGVDTLPIVLLSRLLFPLWAWNDSEGYAQLERAIFDVAWNTGMRAGEILALNRDDLDFERKTIRVNKSSEDKTREIRQPKTRNSVATLPMPSALEATLRNYIKHHWQENPSGLLFPNHEGTPPRKRESVVEYGLKPVLRKLGIPDKDAGLHAFRHGLATELAGASVPLTVLQQQLRHADVKTTLRVYAHAIPESQRIAMEGVALSIGTEYPFGTVSD